MGRFRDAFPQHFAMLSDDRAQSMEVAIAGGVVDGGSPPRTMSETCAW
jgi:hypothetical protein